jgi:hypothetical protein
LISIAGGISPENLSTVIMIPGILTPLIRKFVIPFVSLLIFYKMFSCVYINILLLFLKILIFLSFSYRCKRFGVIMMFLNIVDFKNVISGILIKKALTMK